jgi:YbbR domain-containing protein
VEILRIDPAEMEFVLDSLVQKKLRVEVPRIGSLKKDYRLEDIVVSPAEVLVTGPATEVEGLQTVNTQQVDLRELTEDTVQELPLRMSGKFLRFQPERVSVDIQVRAVTRERRFSEIPVVVTGKNLSQRWIPQPSTVAVEITGPRPIIQKMKSDDVVVVVELPESVEQQTEEERLPLQFPLIAQLPDTVELVQITPREVSIQAASAKTRK